MTVWVLDMDDTLYLERDYARSGFHAVGRWADRKFQVSGFGAACQSLFDTGVRGVVFNRAAEQLNLRLTSGDLQSLVQTYRDHAPQIELAPDARRWLDDRRQGRCALISDGPLVCQRRKAESLELARWLDPLVLTDQWGREFWKPHPRAFDQIQAAFNSPPRDHIYIADNPAKDFTAPKALGWRTIRIRRPAGLHAAAEPDRPDLIDEEIQSFADLD